MLLITEYMPYGDLHKFLVNIRLSYRRSSQESSQSQDPTAPAGGTAPHLYMNDTSMRESTESDDAQATTSIPRGDTTSSGASIPGHDDDGAGQAASGGAQQASQSDLVKRHEPVLGRSVSKWRSRSGGFRKWGSAHRRSSGKSSAAESDTEVIEKTRVSTPKLLKRKTHNKTLRTTSIESPVKTELSLKNMVQFTIEIEHGLAYLASSKFVHRDIAARNMLIAADYTIKITDFGLSRQIDTSKDCKAILGVSRCPTHGGMRAGCMAIAAACSATSRVSQYGEENPAVLRQIHGYRMATCMCTLTHPPPTSLFLFLFLCRLLLLFLGFGGFLGVFFAALATLVCWWLVCYPRSSHSSEKALTPDRVFDASRLRGGLRGGPMDCGRRRCGQRRW